MHANSASGGKMYLVNDINPLFLPKNILINQQIIFKKIYKYFQAMFTGTFEMVAIKLRGL